MALILVIDDDSRLASYLREELGRKGHQVHCLDEAEPALDLLRDSAFEVVLADYSLPGMSGIEFLAGLRERGISVPVILMTGHTTPDTAIRARKLGARDYVVKPLDFHQLVNELEPVIEEMLKISRLNRERVHLPPPDTTLPSGKSAPTLLGNSRPMQKVYERIGQVADSDLPVLLTGETGTGKELIARAIFQHSDRSDRPFVAVNCAAIPESLLESELFGHEKGAFTGAERRRIGKFELADGGTILLDEIGDMNGSTQAKILRALQEGEVVRLGGNEVTKVDVRVLACTNRDLEAAISAGRFREDLYYRLSAVKIHLPPLRERGPDLELLAKYILTRETQGKGRPLLTLHETALKKLRSHPWPGNVRELENVLRLAARVCRGPQVLPDDLELSPPCPSGAKQRPGQQEALAGLQTAIRWAWDTGQTDLWRLLGDRLKSELARFALAHVDGKQVRAAARRLGISPTTLYEWLAEDEPPRSPGGDV